VPPSVANFGSLEKSISAVANAYRGLKVENGFQFDVKTVYRILLPEDSLGEVDCPAIMVVRPEGGSGTIRWQDERAYEEILRLDVVGLLKSDGENAQDSAWATTAEAFLSDLKRLQMTDPQFGLGPAGEIKNSRIISDANDAGWDATTCIVGIGLELTVFFDGVNP
jgi:hypothetical protein